MKNAKVVNGKIEISFGGDDFTSILSKVKSLGGIWIPSQRVWSFTQSTHITNELRSLGFVLPEFIPQKVILPELKKEDAQLFHEKGLFSYQIESVRWFLSKRGVGILGDEMGVGKTVQAISYCVISKKFPVLVVCPATLKKNWQREITKWCGMESHIISGGKIYMPPEVPFYIINYDILSKWADFLRSRLKIKGVIGDEIQVIANPETARTRAFFDVCSEVSQKMLLTGTPIRNCPANFFNALNIVAPSMFPNRWKFLYRYCNPKHNGFSWTYKGATNVEELHELVNRVMLRRRKSEILKELPPKIKAIVPMELEDSRSIEYSNSAKELVEWIKKNGKKVLETRNQIELLKQSAYLAKRNSVISWIETFLESGEKLVVFGIHKKTIADIMSVFGDIAVKVDGSVSGESRQEAVDRFQKDPTTKLFVGNIQAAGVGLTLTAASNVAFVEFPWSPSDLVQAEDRCHRVGTVAECVNIYYLIADETIEVDIIELLQSKNKVIEAVVDGNMDVDYYNGLLELVLKKYQTR